MSDSSYIKKPVSEWPTPVIRQWMYAIEERSDRLISRGMETDDWSEMESDERMHDQLVAELKRRGEKL